MMEEENHFKDRRRFPRFSSQVYYRIGKSQTLRQRVSDISLGGVRIYSDQRLAVGEEVDLELHFPSGFFGKGKARCVWIKELPPNSGTSYEMGLEFKDFPEDTIEELKKTLSNKS
jgi:hypothetical protein